MGRFHANGTMVPATSLTALRVGGGTTVKCSIYDLFFSCGSTPADQQILWTVGHVTTAGTAGAAVTPQPLDEDAPVALGTAGSAFLIANEPTYATVPLIKIGLHQRAVYRWVARERGELVTGKTANHGIGAKAAITSGTPTLECGAHWYE